MANNTMSKSDLQEEIQAGRLLLDGILQRVDHARMLDPVLEGGRSVKDVIAHVTAWEQRLLGWLATAATGETPQLPAPGYTWAELDEVNALSYERLKDQPLDATLASYSASLALIFAALAHLSEEDLNRQYFETESESLWQFFAANTYWHYREHAEEIAAWLDG